MHYQFIANYQSDYLCYWFVDSRGYSQAIFNNQVQDERRCLHKQMIAVLLRNEENT